MGDGRWEPKEWATYSSTKVAGKSTKEVYSSTKIDADLDPKGVTIRESRDSEDNPESNAIIVGLDVTGSMHRVLDAMAREGLPTLCEEIYNRKPVSDPHIMCMGIGDVEAGDRAPLQTTQFEADIRIADQLTKIWLEGGGGGNSYESYHLPWYFAGMHTSIDCFEKRGKKGYLFTVGDEETPKGLNKKYIEQVFGDKLQANLNLHDMLDMATKMYHVFHIMVEEGNHYRHRGHKVVSKWTDLLGQRAIKLSDHTKLAEVIVSTIQLNEGGLTDDIVDSWDGTTGLVVKRALDGMDITKQSGDIVNL